MDIEYTLTSARNGWMLRANHLPGSSCAGNHFWVFETDKSLCRALKEIIGPQSRELIQAIKTKTGGSSSLRNERGIAPGQSTQATTITLDVKAK